MSILARDPDLPLHILQELYQQHATPAPDQVQLITAKTACGDLAGVQWMHSHGGAWQLGLGVNL